ncbi:MAG: acyltransferase [Bacteroidales bacterium]|nr:acyltransferase [Bacteroidales bacterium]
MTQGLNTGNFIKGLFQSHTPTEFNGLSIELFHYQLNENHVYAEYISYLGIDTAKIHKPEQIPFLPIGFFKTHTIKSGMFQEEIIFKSSGTGGMQRSKHFVRSMDLYRKSFYSAFMHFYGDPANYRFLGLLPSYLEREGSSLIFMAKALAGSGAYAESGFYLDEFGLLANQLLSISQKQYPAIILGVSFALLDFAEKYPVALGKNVIVMETGGMKGRREELPREDLHGRLCEAFKIEAIHSEYGMTELLTQAYSKGWGRFKTPPWMKVFIRDIQDPFTILPQGQTGAINIIDLANVHSCAFIETQDIGRLHPDGTFEVLGRTDSSDIRGCSLLLA